MTAQDLASIFGPTLLESDGEQVEAQNRLAETVINYALDMFELGTFQLIPTLNSKTTNDG